MLINISHKTTYHYEAPVHYTLQQVRLTPKNRIGQKVLDWKIDVDHGKVEMEFDDHHNNLVTVVSLEKGFSKIEISAEGTVETTNKNGIMGKHGGYAPFWLFKKQTELTQAGPLMKKLIKAHNKTEDKVAMLHALSADILSLVPYKTGTTSINTTAEDALSLEAGVCQDHTHIMLSAARHMGLPARYVSGYLLLDGQTEQDASHAWAEIYVKGLGWVGFDVSNGISPDERYVPIATGLDYDETAPISGMRFGHGDETMIVSLQVQQ